MNLLDPHVVTKALGDFPDGDTEIVAETTGKGVDVPQEIRDKKSAVFVLSSKNVHPYTTVLCFWLAQGNGVEHFCTMPWSNVKKLFIKDRSSAKSYKFFNRQSVETAAKFRCISNDDPIVSAPRGNLKIA